MEKLNIRSLINRIDAGDIRIPAFQRDYVWDNEQVAFLMDSIYKQFPIGSIFLWKTDNKLTTEKRLGEFTLPEPQKDYPVNYVLDGQQRITSLYTAFQTVHQSESNTDVYFDMSADASLQDSFFHVLGKDEVDSKKHFPISTFFDVAAYRKATKTLSDEEAERIDSVQTAFKEYDLLHEVFTSEDQNEVAIVFERINRQKTELSNFDLLSAWSWSEDFDLTTKFNELGAELESAGYEGLKEKRDLLLRVCAAVLKGNPAPGATLTLAGEEVRTRFNEIKQGIKGAVDFLKTELQVKSFEMLPSPAIITPLATFFATAHPEGTKCSAHQRKELKKWFWTTLFAKRYMSDSTQRQTRDIEEFEKLKSDDSYGLIITPSEMKISFHSDKFGNNMPSKTLLLLLAQTNPQSLLSLTKIETNKVLTKVNKNEFHHVFPRKYLKDRGNDESDINVLANICFLTRSDNNRISSKSPKIYSTSIPQKERSMLLKKAFIPENFGSQNYKDFRSKRTQLLQEEALRLMS